jgi:hypothetical protein
MTSRPAPLEQFYDLRRLSEAGIEIKIDADVAARERLAVWLDIESVKSLNAIVTLKRKSPSKFAYEASFVCDLVQSSVVSLEPIEAHIDEQFTREVHLNERGRHAAQKGEALTLDAGDDESPEEIDNPQYDLAAPILEELSLALDPYPRARGEEFTEPDLLGPEKVNPFAVLKVLKEKG